MTMKKQIIYMVCATALLSSCHIYKAYERPDSIDATGIYRDPVSETDTLASADTTNMGNLPWKEVFRDPKLQALIEEGLANNVDMQAAVLRVEEAKVLLTSARLSFLPSINFAPQGTITSIGNSEYVKAYSTPLAASWEVDLRKAFEREPWPKSFLLTEPVFKTGRALSIDRWYSEYLLYLVDA